jgi:hypothetical protein
MQNRNYDTTDWLESKVKQILRQKIIFFPPLETSVGQINFNYVKLYQIYTSPHVEIKVPNFSDYVVSLYYYKALL